VDAKERARLETYLKSRFGSSGLTVRARPQKKDSAEVYIGEEFAGILSRDDEDDDLCWHFTMTVLEADLEG
jgi:hypothetical protein